MFSTWSGSAVCCFSPPRFMSMAKQPRVYTWPCAAQYICIITAARRTILRRAIVNGNVKAHFTIVFRFLSTTRRFIGSNREYAIRPARFSRLSRVQAPPTPGNVHYRIHSINPRSKLSCMYREASLWQRDRLGEGRPRGSRAPDTFACLGRKSTAAP